jgi:hypothetical protein
VRPGGEEVTIRCRKVAQDRAVTVHVTDPDGRPFEGVRVSVWGSSRTGPGHVTGTEGRATIAELPAETARLVAYPVSGTLRRDWFAPVPRDIVPAGQVVALQFRRGVEVRGLLTDRDGEGIAGADVRARRESRLLSQAKTDAGGGFSLFVPEGTEHFDLDAQWATSDAGTGRTSASGVAPGTDIRLVAN